MRKLGIYVQVPFCQTKCTYCNFHTGVVAKTRFAPYAEAVCREIKHHREWLNTGGIDWPGRLGRSRAVPLQGESEATGEIGALPGQEHSQECVCYQDTVDTVYFGGGTPSLLEPGHLQKILEAIRESFERYEIGKKQRRDAEDTEIRREERKPQEQNQDKELEQERSASPTASGQMHEGLYSAAFEEVTLEADPETIEAKKAAEWARAGINRVRFGVQSFSDVELVAAGRMHRRADIYRAVPILRQAGIRNISFDLIAGLPHQTKESWKQSLEELTALAPEHVSVYLLEVDEGSRLGKELLAGGARYSAGAVPSEDEMAEFYEMAQATLA